MKNTQIAARRIYTLDPFPLPKYLATSLEKLLAVTARMRPLNYRALFPNLPVGEPSLGVRV